MAKWTAADMPDQTGRLAVVTGANSGIGLIAARELARAGATVVLACRDPERAAQAARAIRDAAAGARVEVQALDLADLASVAACAQALHDAHDHLDLLVNNAGVMATPHRTTADGFELQLGTNHLGHFALTGRLLDLLLAARAPRVVTVSSGAHRFGRMNFEDLQSERRYNKWRAYGQSKLANLLFAFELQRRATAAGSELLSVAAHPGWAATNLQFAGPQMAGSGLEEHLAALGNRLFAQSDEQGALPTLYAATVTDIPPGAYVGPDGFLEQRGHPKLVGTTSAARDEHDAAELWAVSQELTGVRFDFGVQAPA
ncbi:MAG TPA: oxidoreductase [Solirubrobacteraceae bacterium]|nr:oxidoreductase [Solirubrobacteraceae bacterium]